MDFLKMVFMLPLMCKGDCHSSDETYSLALSFYLITNLYNCRIKIMLVFRYVTINLEGNMHLHLKGSGFRFIGWGVKGLG